MKVYMKLNTHFHNDKRRMAVSLTLRAEDGIQKKKLEGIDLIGNSFEDYIREYNKQGTTRVSTMGELSLLHQFSMPNSNAISEFTAKEIQDEMRQLAMNIKEGLEERGHEVELMETTSKGI